MEKPVKAVVLAAGRGTRLRTEGSDIPKVMRSAAGRPLLSYVLQALSFIPPRDTLIVVGYRKEMVVGAFPGYCFAEQREQLGTGHAVMSAFDALADYHGDLLICCGDMPLIRRETYLALWESHKSAGGACTILSGTSDFPHGYGRVLRDKAGRFAAIVEEKDCTSEQLAAAELNSAVYLFDADALGSVLGRLQRGNAQGEYYLTDAPGLLLRDGQRVDICNAASGDRKSVV
jgi:bifunctional N-acetylglucosamine-1-phosphate-uridyltransferase/glucosamine-1-phosphate-acetyltransferase GlmU-like protein